MNNQSRRQALQLSRKRTRAQFESDDQFGDQKSNNFRQADGVSTCPQKRLLQISIPKPQPYDVKNKQTDVQLDFKA